MPYISKERRPEIDKLVDALGWILEDMDATDGDVNYAITRLLVSLYPPVHYLPLERAIGLLECVKLEFYRRRVVLYEDIKKEENGDVF